MPALTLKPPLKVNTLTHNAYAQADEVGESNQRLKRLHTIFKEYANETEDLVEVKVRQFACPKLITSKTKIMAVVTLISIFAFIFFATIAFFNPMCSKFGPGILFSRGAALSILLLTIFAMFLVTYDLTTCIQKKIKKRCSTLFDFQILFHRFSGFLITFYSIVHTIGHLTSSIKYLDQEDDLDKINSVLTHKKFNKHKTYAELLFTTIPGVTGILLLAIISFM
jgi:hypothetical protein